LGLVRLGLISTL